MGATFCCMNTISQLGEGELDIASGTLTGKKSAKTRQTPTAMSEFASVHFWKCVCEKNKVIGV